MAERVGFEPTVGKPDTRSPGVPVRPLQHLSAERVGFEPTRHFCPPLFESGTINHSVTSPEANFEDVGSHKVFSVNNLSIIVSDNLVFNRLIILWRYQFIKTLCSSFLLSRRYIEICIETFVLKHKLASSRIF
jgi:hypothetical protein